MKTLYKCVQYVYFLQKNYQLNKIPIMEKKERKDDWNDFNFFEFTKTRFMAQDVIYSGQGSMCT